MPRKMFFDDGTFEGWGRGGTIEAMAMYMAVYQLSPLGPHRPLADKLLGPLRTKCTTCDGNGLLGTERDTNPRECSHCEGTGGFWNCTDAELAAAYAQVLEAYPDARVKSGRIPQGTFRVPRFGVDQPPSNQIE